MDVCCILPHKWGSDHTVPNETSLVNWHIRSACDFICHAVVLYTMKSQKVSGIGFEEINMEPSDEMLVLACQQGDEAAWEQLIARYERLIYTIARRCAPDEEEAVDVFQHVFAQLVEHIQEIEEPARIRTWLTKTARYEAWRL